MSTHTSFLLVGLLVWAPLTTLGMTACDNGPAADHERDGAADSSAVKNADSAPAHDAASADQSIDAADAASMDASIDAADARSVDGSIGAADARSVDASIDVVDSGRCYPVADLPTPPVVDAAAFGRVFCPFLPEASTVSEHFCTTGDHCCQGPEGAWSSCTPSAEACTGPAGGIDWWCQYPGAGQCESDEVCCATGTLVLSPSADAGDAGCGNYVHGFKNTSCVAAAMCPAGQIQMCATDLDCPTGEHCYAFQAGDIKELGGCQ
jgi:hypothetical protein